MFFVSSVWYFLMYVSLVCTHHSGSPLYIINSNFFFCLKLFKLVSFLFPFSFVSFVCDNDNITMDIKMTRNIFNVLD